ncbi:hypothetical protein GUJ93_ZPchr0004g39535 [Zizania palustris]|uniref:Uncharacterized protein n=1 Tax=Zizania palustris TaxID=103762 RepID=A0A8J5SEW1_ZIZPA|nr:hypothetical protein GUJ93_ZPchr0004g39535 [Zizania palustris]
MPARRWMARSGMRASTAWDGRKKGRHDSAMCVVGGCNIERVWRELRVLTEAMTGVLSTWEVGMGLRCCVRRGGAVAALRVDGGELWTD